MHCLMSYHFSLCVPLQHLLARTPSDEPVHILNTQLAEGREDVLLTVTYTDVNKNSPEFQTVHESVLKRLDITLSSVKINCHQDAILDLVNKMTKFISELSSNAKRLLAQESSAHREAAASSDFQEAEEASEQHPAGHRGSESLSHDQHHGGLSLSRQNASKRLTRKFSVRASRWAFRAKKKSQSLQNETVEVKVVASLDSVHFEFMTTRIHFARLQGRRGDRKKEQPVAL